MYSVLMSGYMFANAWTRLSLTRSLGEHPRALLAEPAARSSSASLASVASGGSMDGPEGAAAASPYAPGSQVGCGAAVVAAHGGGRRLGKGHYAFFRRAFICPGLLLHFRLLPWPSWYPSPLP